MPCECDVLEIVFQIVTYNGMPMTPEEINGKYASKW